MAEEKLINLKEEELHELIKNKLIAAGLDENQAVETANHLTYADMIGIHSHGAVRVEYYAERINKGGVTNSPKLEFEKTGNSTGIFHGDNAQGQFVANEALEPAIKMAKETGVAVVGVSKCGHTGTLSYYLEKVAKEGLFGFAVTNSDPMVVPFGGAEPYYGTNPIAFCAPGEEEDIVFDMATTVQAWGKVLDARSKGHEIPADWAVDSEGHPTTDPNNVGGLVAIAGPKGYGLMMLVDVLSAVLLGLPSGKSVSSMYDNLHEGRNLGQTYILIDPERFVGAEAFKQGIQRTIDELHAIKPAKGFDAVQIPGEGANKRREYHQSHGVEIPESIVNYLKSDVIHNDAYEGLSPFAN